MFILLSIFIHLKIHVLCTVFITVVYTRKLCTVFLASHTWLVHICRLLIIYIYICYKLPWFGKKIYFILFHITMGGVYTFFILDFCDRYLPKSHTYRCSWTWLLKPPPPHIFILISNLYSALKCTDTLSFLHGF